MNATALDAARIERALMQPQLRGDSLPAERRPPLPSLPPVPPESDVAPPLETIRSVATTESLAMEAIANGDPSVLMSAMAMQLRRSTMNAAESGLRANRTGEREHTAAQLAAYQRASEAQRNAANWATVAKVGAYVAASLSIVIGVAGALYSGGSSVVAGVGLALVIVSSAATLGVMAAQDLGAWDGGPPPRPLMIAIAIVALLGAVCSLGAGSGSAVATVGALVSITAQTVSITADIGAECHWWDEPPPEFKLVLACISLAGSLTSAASGIGSAANESVNIVGKTVSATSQIVRGAALVAQGVGTMGAAAMNYQADLARIDGDNHKSRREALRMQDEDLVEAIRHAMKSFQRTVRIASDTQMEASAARTRMTGNFARA